MPRFVILTHDHPFPHWDLMLERDGVLRTWRLLQEPAPEATVPAEPLPDHRRHYLDYEGPVGGGRGEVRRWDLGQYELCADATTLRVELHGQRLSGIATYCEGDGEGPRWCFAESESRTSR